MNIQGAYGIRPWCGVGQALNTEFAQAAQIITDSSTKDTKEEFSRKDAKHVLSNVEGAAKVREEW